MAERKRTNAEIDTLNKFLSEGETPLPYELDAAEGSIVIPPTEVKKEIIPEAKKVEIELTEEQKAEQEKIEADKIAAQKILDENKEALDKLNDSEKEKIISADKEKVAEVKEIPEFELDDEKVLAYLRKSKGKEIASLDDFINPPKELSQEEKIAAKEKRESNMFAHGLTSGLFTKKELENFISDTKNPSEVVFTAYANDQKKKDDTLTDEEIRDEFNSKFGLDIEDKEDRQYIAGQNLINKIADSIIKEHYPKIVNIDKEYSSFESSQESEAKAKNKIATQTPLYAKDIQGIISSSKKINIPISDKENFEFLVEDKILDEVAQEMLSENISHDNINKGWTKDNLTQITHLTALMKSLPKLMNDFADKKLLEKQAGLKGVKPNGKEGEREKVEKELTENQKKAISMMDERLSLAN